MIWLAVVGPSANEIHVKGVWRYTEDFMLIREFEVLGIFWAAIPIMGNWYS